MARVRATKEERRAAILDAGREVFARDGLERARMEEIARRAQVGKGTLYEHFESKEGLFLAVGSDLIDQNLRRIEGMTAEVEDPRAGLRLLLRELLTSVETFFPVLGLYFETWTLAMARDDLRQDCLDRFRQLYVPARDVIARLVRQGKRQGLFETHDGPRVASLMLAVVDGIAYQTLFLLELDDLPGLARSAEKLFFRGLDRRP